MACSQMFPCRRRVLRLRTSVVPHRQLSASQEHGKMPINVKEESIHSCACDWKNSSSCIYWMARTAYRLEKPEDSAPPEAPTAGEKISPRNKYI